MVSVELQRIRHNDVIHAQLKWFLTCHTSFSCFLLFGLMTGLTDCLATHFHEHGIEKRRVTHTANKALLVPLISQRRHNIFFDCLSTSMTIGLLHSKKVLHAI
eukprot:TRINITY_DN5272_c0_g1_i2.p2 TRINITY_DN5272_c0_g1~~TRINITY_DN5272_c0_g1_i2.p2  ORF type:complete len:103 (+),score=21.28 TRINITY_DN5272_c0_g1_i2:129-437(+)